MRINKDEYYLKLAADVAKRGTCLRRNYGAVIVNNDEIISTGYTGTPRGSDHCKTCKRQELQIPSGQRYELCRSVHAEQNAIISASRKEMLGSTLYLAGWDLEHNDAEIECPECCSLCKRMIINAGISRVVTKHYIFIVEDWIKEV